MGFRCGLGIHSFELIIKKVNKRDDMELLVCSRCGEFVRHFERGIDDENEDYDNDDYGYFRIEDDDAVSEVIKLLKRYQPKNWEEYSEGIRRQVERIKNERRNYVEFDGKKVYG